MIRKRYQLNWMFECPEAVLTCSILKCHDNNYLVFGGHDKTIYLMDENMNIVDDRVFDGWCRCSYTIDLDGDGCDEILVGAGDGSFMVLKLNIETQKLVGIMRYRSTQKINCCIAGDFTRNGKFELIFGGEDKTLKIFESVKSENPKFTLYYDSWVTACTLGHLKLPDEKIPIYGLLVGNKNGLLQLIQIQNDVPDIIWQKDFQSQINDIKIGDVTNNGLNEIILSTDDSTIKILSSSGEILKEIVSEEARPLSLLIEDIDGDNAREIVVGCADGSLKVFHNPSLNSNDIELKWKTKVATSIKDICYLLGKDQSSKHIVFGGYDRAIRNITDFEFGQKPVLDIPQQLQVPEVQVSKETQIEEEIQIKEIPTNIREYIFKILKDVGFLHDLIKELMKLGYTRSEIIEELEIMRTQKMITYEKVTYPIWSLPGEEMPEKGKEVEIPVEEPKVMVKPMVIEEVTQTSKKRLVDALDLYPSGSEEIASSTEVASGKSLKDAIIDYLRQYKLVSSITKLIEDLVQIGFTKDNVEKEIESLKEQGIIIYSRGKPRGWSIAKE
ncbi:MAG: hypothetical protein ACFFA6_10465 [Promethearchaeota archaeon]